MSSAVASPHWLYNRNLFFCMEERNSEISKYRLDRSGLRISLFIPFLDLGFLDVFRLFELRLGLETTSNLNVFSSSELKLPLNALDPPKLSQAGSLFRHQYQRSASNSKKPFPITLSSHHISTNFVCHPNESVQANKPLPLNPGLDYV